MYSNFLKCFPFPLLLIASTIFPALLDLTSQKRHLKPIHRWCSGTNQSTAWIATWNQPARLPHIPCRPCKALGTSQTNLLCSRKKQQHEPSHPQWTCCSPKSGLFACHHASKADSTLSTSQPVPYVSTMRALSCLTSEVDFRGRKRSGAFRRIWPSAVQWKLLKLTGQAICISRCQNWCSFAL